MGRPKKNSVRFKLKPFRNQSGSSAWRVTGSKADGTRVRQNFADKAEALRSLADLELESEGQPESRKALRTCLTPAQLADAEAASEQLKGESLATVAAHYLSLRSRALSKGATLDAALAFFESRYTAESRSISILNARDEFLASRDSIRRSTRTNYESGLRLLLKPDPNKPVHAFTVRDLEQALAGYPNANSKRTMRRIFSIFFNWSVRHHYCLEDPCKRLDKPPKDTTQIAILSVTEVTRLLAASVSYKNGVMAASVAILLFAGLRPSELSELKETDIKPGKIRVTGGKLRRTLKRTVPIPPVLEEWLKIYPFSGLPVGWNYKLKILKAATAAQRWVQDILRHTSISFQVERDQNEALTAFNCGTSKTMIDGHYRDSIFESEDVITFWSLTPERLNPAKVEVILPLAPKVVWPANRDLKRLVWSKPLIHAAKELGVSDVALKRRCINNGIPTPPPGYWITKKLRGPMSVV